MNYTEIIIIAIGLSMDAFAVSVGKGLSVRTLQIRHILCVGLWFGGFQGLMPLVGYLIGTRFSALLQQIDHWIAFILLALIGFNMIRDSFSEDENDSNADFSIKTMFLMAVATSIDALVIGVSFAFFNTPPIPAAVLIGVITCVLSGIGLVIGYRCGNYFQSKAEFAGGMVLCLIGLKILIEHMYL